MNTALTTLATIPFRPLSRLDIGPLTIRTFGVLVGLGIAAGILIVARKLTDAGDDSQPVERLAIQVVMIGVVGARLAWVLTNLDQIASPIDVIAVWEGGLQFSGGFIAGMAWGTWQLRGTEPGLRRRIGDAAALGMTVGMAIGRAGCVAVGEHWGRASDFALALRYEGGRLAEGDLTVGIAYHNTALYEGMHLTVLALIFVVLLRSGRLKVGEGRMTSIFLVWYGTGRFLTDTLRVDDTRVLGMTGAQIVSILVVASGVVLWRRASARSADPGSAADGARDVVGEGPMDDETEPAVLS